MEHESQNERLSVSSLSSTKTLTAANSAARSLRNDPEFDPQIFDGISQADSPIQVADQWYRVRDAVVLSSSPVREQVITLENITQTHLLLDQENRIKKRTRNELKTVLQHTLGTALDDVVSAIEEMKASNDLHLELSQSLSELETLTRHCRQVAEDTLEHQAFLFKTDNELWDALTSLRKEVKEVHSFEVTVSQTSLPEFDCPRDRSLFFLILQEAIRNAYRHSGGSEMMLELRPEVCILHDNGSGLEEEKITKDGLGCENIIARADQLGFDARLLQDGRNGWNLQSKKTDSTCDSEPGV